jgi:hypothetical protein
VRRLILTLILVATPALAAELPTLATSCRYPPGIPYARATLVRADGYGSLDCEGNYDQPYADPADGRACICVPHLFQGVSVLPWCTVVVLESDSTTEATCVQTYSQPFVVQAFTITSPWKTLRGRKK